jgi:hypothetical protein
MNREKCEESKKTHMRRKDKNIRITKCLWDRYTPSRLSPEESLGSHQGVPPKTPPGNQDRDSLGICEGVRESLGISKGVEGRPLSP